MAGTESRPDSRGAGDSRLTRAAFAGVLAVVALAPLPFASNRPWSWTVLSLLVGLLLIVWAVAAMRDPGAVGEPWRRVRPFALVFAVVVAWIVAQASSLTPQSWHHPLWQQTAAALETPLPGAVSIDPQQTLVALMRLLAYAGVFWLGWQLGRARDRARRTVWLVALAGFVYSLYGLIVDLAGLDTILWYKRWAYLESLTSTFVNRNSFATYAGLALLATLGILLHEVGKGARGNVFSRSGLRWMIEGFAGRPGLLVVMALVTGSALLLTDSRGGLISALVGLMVLAVAWAAHPGSRPVPALAAAAALGLFALAIVTLSGEVAVDRLERTFVAPEERSAVYALVIRGIRENPWLGTGYGTFESAFPLIRDSSVFGDLVYDKAHNTYLEFAFETGVPAFGLMMGLFAGFTWMCARGVWVRRRDRHYPCIGLAATALVGTHALVDFSLQIPAVAVTYALLLGMACAQSRSGRRSEIAATPPAGASSRSP